MVQSGNKQLMLMNLNLVEEIIRDFWKVGFQPRRGFTMPPTHISVVLASLGGVLTKITDGQVTADERGLSFKARNRTFTKEECHL